VVSADGQAVLVGDENRAWTRVEVATGRASAVAWPGAVEMWPTGTVVAWPARDLVLSWCLPTEGAPIKYTTSNSPLRGPKQMLTLKLSRLNSDKFQTVVPYIDPRTKVSFGQVGRTPSK